MSDILEGLTYALSYNCVVILYGHGISEKVLPMYVPISRLETIAAFISKHNMKFYTLSELGSY
jgi:hypothetical protein